MFHVFEAPSANQVWRKIAARLASKGSGQGSRAGGTREIMRAAIGIVDPRQRWIVARTPAVNPAFAIAEAIWIVAGRNDAAFLNYFNRSLPDFAGRGATYHGAYGHRIRRHLAFDQLERAFHILRRAPDSRQVVLQIWDGQVDMPRATGQPRAEDIPCNVLTLLKVRGGRLELTEIVRSNDAFRGLPYNIVQFTTLQEVLAGWLGVGVGHYAQLSDSLHVYERDVECLESVHTGRILKNTDSLSLPKRESDRAIRTLTGSIETIIDVDASANAVVRAFETARLPGPYANLLRVLCADGLRRRGQDRLSAVMMRSCTNPSLRQVWSRWTDRVG